MYQQKKTGGYCEEHKHLVKDDKLKCSEPKCKHKVFKDGICRQHYIEKLDFSQLKGVVTPLTKKQFETMIGVVLKIVKMMRNMKGTVFYMVDSF